MSDDIFVKDHGEIRQQQEAEAVNAEKQLRISFGVTFSTPEGFAVLQALQTFCHGNEVTYRQGDTHESAFREGERNVFLFITSQLSDDLRQKLK